MKRLTLSDLHTHTTFSDGKDSPLDMVFSAVDKGLEVLGFSDHSYTDFDESYCMRENDCFDYIEEIDCLKNQFADDITILCGIEQDFYSTASLTGFDYVIGSVHYILPDGFSYDDGCSVLTPELLKDPLLEKKGAFIPVDETPELLMGAAKVFFDGDIYALAEKYFLTVSLVAEKIRPDIIGHFDLISKFNEKMDLFDPENERYRAVWMSAALKLLESDIPFEINSGAMSRGYRSAPYPSLEMISFIKEKGGRFVLSSDAHSADSICYKFNELERLIY